MEVYNKELETLSKIVEKLPTLNVKDHKTLTDTASVVLQIVRDVTDFSSASTSRKFNIELLRNLIDSFNKEMDLLSKKRSHYLKSNDLRLYRDMTISYGKLGRIVKDMLYLERKYRNNLNDYIAFSVRDDD